MDESKDEVLTPEQVTALTTRADRWSKAVIDGMTKEGMIPVAIIAVDGRVKNAEGLYIGDIATPGDWSREQAQELLRIAIAVLETAERENVPIEQP